MIELKVERLTCGGCAATVRAAVLEAAPAARMEIVIATGLLRIGGTVDEDRIRAAIEKAGYTIAGEV